MSTPKDKSKFAWHLIGRQAYEMKVATGMSWRAIAEVVSPPHRVLHGQTIKEHAFKWAEKTGLSQECLKRGGGR